MLGRKMFRRREIAGGNLPGERFFKWMRRALGTVALCFVALGIFASDALAASHCGGAIADFLAAPSESTLKSLQRRESSASCWSTIGSSDLNLNKLNHWVQQGDLWAARYLA